jgi:hypothetical protein
MLKHPSWSEPMLKYTRLRTPLALAFAAALAGCGGNDGAASDSALLQDSALNRDLALANQGDSLTQPDLTDIPAAPAAPLTVDRAPAPTPRPTTSAPVRRPTPAPRPSTPAATTTPSGNTVSRNPSGTAGSGSVGSIPAGSVLTLASTSKVCTNTHRVGDKFTATVGETVTGSNGAEIPAGATATLEVTSVKRSENAADEIEMGVRMTSLTFGGRSYAVDATTQSASVRRVRNQPSSKDRQKVIGGAIIGAVAGQVLGKDTKGTVIGAAAGAAAGTAAAAATANYEGCINDGGRIVVKLNESTQVRAE